MADFKLGRIKFKWRGDWAVSTGYVIDDIAKYGGNTYVCIQNHTSPANENVFYTDPGTYTNYWQLHGESLFFKGDYANATWYKLNDLVKYGGKQYRCTTAHTSSSTVLNQSNFEALVDGLTFTGDYASSTQYKLNDIVKYGGRQYRVTTEHTSAAGGDANIDLSKFTLYSEGLAFRGDFQVSTYYRLDDVVKYGAYQYKCSTAHTSGAALSDFAEANFTVYSEGLQFEDSYNSATVYSKGDVVTYGGYSYVYINSAEAAGQTPADNAYWDVVTTGFNATGVYSHGTLYKTGDTVQYGGNSYVCILDAQNQRPTAANGTVNSTYWKGVVEGFKWRGTYDSSTTYEIGDTVRYSSSSYVQVQDQVTGVQPGTDSTKWQVLAQGDTAAVLTTRGDLLYQDVGGAARLPLGLPGSVLTNDGTDIVWSGISGKNVLWVSPSGVDGSAGTESMPYQTLAYALKKAKKASIREVETISGGTGGTSGTYDGARGISYKEFTVATTPTTTSFTINLATSAYAHTYVDGGSIRKSDDSTLTVTNAPYDNSTGIITITTSNVHGLSATDKVRIRGMNYTCALGAKVYPETGSDSYYRVNTATSPVTVEIVNGGSDHTAGDKIRVDGSLIGSATTALTFDVKSVAGDIVRLKNGTFKEKLPLRVKDGVSIIGESLRNTRVQPKTGTGSQIKTVKVTKQLVGATNGIYKYLHADKVEKSFTVASVTNSTTFVVSLGTSDFVHTYIDGGTVRDSSYSQFDISDAPYNNSTGDLTITTSINHGLSASDVVKISGIRYSCTEGEKVYPEVGSGAVFSVFVSGNIAKEITTYHGGAGYNVNDVITLKAADVGNGGDLVLTVGSLEDNKASNEFLCNDSNNIRNMTLTGLTGTKLSGGLYQATVTSSNSFTVPTETSAHAHNYVSGGHVIVEGAEGTTVALSNCAYAHATGELTVTTGTNHGLTTGDWVTLGRMKWNITDVGERVIPKGNIMAAVASLDPAGNIKTTSPYIQNCTSINAGACGVQVDGNLHAKTHTSSYKSMLLNDFTQINNDGMGIHILGKGRCEAVSVFVYYAEKAIYAESGGFIRGLNCSHAYGEKACVSSGTDEDESPVSIRTRGMMLKYDATGFQGGATVADIENSISTQGQGTATIEGASSGATARLFRFNVSLQYLHIDNISGGFIDNEIITITKEDSSTFQVQLFENFGDSSNAQEGQRGPLIAVKSGSTTLNATGIIKLASNVKFAGDTKYYRVGLVSEEDTTNGTAVVRLTEDVGTSKAKDENVVTETSSGFSNIRLTGHDFLSIGTGDVITTNYPGTPSQPADQSDEVIEEDGGRVYWVSTDQQGDFRVGELFKIEQATGSATLNADAFNLSGLSELRLGSIGAELGAAINEFSTDETLGGNSNNAVPTENAMLGYMTRDKAGTGGWVPPTGTTAQRPVGGSLFAGQLRYNTSLVAWEGYNGSSWTGLGGGTPWSTITGDGSTTTTAESNQRFLVDTTSYETTINLPASPLVGDSVVFLDLAGTFQSNKLTVGRNGKKIMNLTEDMTAETNHAGFTLVYTGPTYGWKLVEVA
tara:strand:- start:1333 stop:5997 length:4665 start_codon:yes stop_codon:yes gene_type:complete